MITLLLVSGAALLVVGAELLVRGAARIATAAGIQPLVIGLTVVAYGTSAPELAVSLRATFGGEAAIAVGNVVGSNTFNILFILGISALIAPLVVQRQLVRLDVPIMIATSVLLLVLVLDGVIGRLDGLLLVACVLGYTGFLFRQRAQGATSTGGNTAAQAVPRKVASSIVLRSAVVALIGLVLLVIGSRYFVNGAVALARLMGVSEIVVGLTIIAAGTSLPELATSVLASIRGERDIAVGNVVGSNIFNILAILGVCGVSAPDGLAVDAAFIVFDIPVMIAVAIATLPIFFTGYRISRLEGLLFLGYYVAYTLFLVLEATQHDALAAYGLAMKSFVLPLTALTIAVVVYRSVRAGQRPADADVSTRQ